MLTLIKPESELNRASSNYSWCGFHWDTLGYCKVNANGAFFTVLPYTHCLKAAVGYCIIGPFLRDCPLHKYEGAKEMTRFRKLCIVMCIGKSATGIKLN